MSKDIDTITKTPSSPSPSHAETLESIGVHTLTLTLTEAKFMPRDEKKPKSKDKFILTWSDLSTTVLFAGKCPLQDGRPYNVTRRYNVYEGGHGWQLLSATPAPAKK
jgi:hypothetical protein